MAESREDPTRFTAARLVSGGCGRHTGWIGEHAGRGGQRGRREDQVETGLAAAVQRVRLRINFSKVKQFGDVGEHARHLLVLAYIAAQSCQLEQLLGSRVGEHPRQRPHEHGEHAIHEGRSRRRRTWWRPEIERIRRMFPCEQAPELMAGDCLGL